MQLSPHSKRWIWIVTGSALLLGIGISLLPMVMHMESAFYRQLLALSPQQVATADALEFPRVLHLILITVLIGGSGWCLARAGCTVARLIVVVPVCSSLLMLEILLAVMAQQWLPVLWPLLCFGVLTMILYFWEKYPQIKQFVLPEKLCRLETIRHYIDQEDYRTAILIMKNCPFTDDMFELAYELGMELEQKQNWIQARNLYAWLVQFDPGIKDFVERIDTITQPGFVSDATFDDITSEHMFGQYHLLGKKAHGATSTVYEAQDHHTHKRIALKVLDAPLDDATESQEIMAFLHEALTASRLDHPNIVKIHDADIHDERAFIAMDFITGYPMSERLRRQKLITVGEALRVMIQVLDALVLAHQKGIVHGDIKPANIMYEQSHKQYIVTDFGAAYSDFRDKDDSRKIIGTPAYMSPEQLKGNRIDGRSDLFSLAVTIYHLLSGRQPFSGERLSEIKQAVIGKEVEMDTLKLPSCLATIIAKALAKKPYQRYADASQMLRAVHQCEERIKKTSAATTQD